MASSSLQSCLGLSCNPKLKLKLCKYRQVKAHSPEDEERSPNIVDESMESLRGRMEELRRKEGLQKYYNKCQYGWGYSPGYDHLLKKEAKSREVKELMVMAAKMFGLTVAMSSLLLCIVSIVLHLRVLAH
ncbi:hypothetical protein ACHQM5_006135 [Ranunculus cassubicifolius]